MSQLIEQDFLKAARVLDCARELVLKQGVRKVTISEIAECAGVGKGTVYLYWSTKEDLIFGLFGREILSWIEKINFQIRNDPRCVLPGRLAPLLVRTTLENPWLRRIHGDEEVLRLFSHHPLNRTRFAEASPSAMCRAVMPILRDHGLLRRDIPLAMQEYATHALLIGFGMVMRDPALGDSLSVDDPEDVLAETARMLLEPLRPPEDEAITAAANAVWARFQEVHGAMLKLIQAAPGAG